MGVSGFDWILVPLLCLGYLLSTHAYPSGPPSSVCASMTPHHGPMVVAQDSESPYSITLNTQAYTIGENVSVTISSVTGGEALLGFFMQARTADSQDAKGKFNIGADTELKLITCPVGSSDTNAVSHSSNATKTIKVFNWSSSDDVLVGSDIFFKLTIVQNKTVYWTDVHSANLKVAAAKGGATTLSSFFVVTLVVVNVLLSFHHNSKSTL